MFSALVLGVFWIGYGISGLIGIQNVARKYKDTFLEKDYKKFSDKGFIFLGAMCIVMFLVNEIIDLTFWYDVTIDVIILIPVIIYTIIGEKRFKKIFEENSEK